MKENIKLEPEDFFKSENLLDPGEQYSEEKEDKMEKDLLSEQGWPSSIPFCIAVGYKHCGPGCGDGLTYGGGTPFNALDSCCRAHDRCYKNFPNDKSCCDRYLADCASTINSTWADLIWAYFNGGKC